MMNLLKGRSTAFNATFLSTAGTTITVTVYSHLWLLKIYTYVSFSKFKAQEIHNHPVNAFELYDNKAAPQPMTDSKLG